MSIVESTVDFGEGVGTQRGLSRPTRRDVDFAGVHGVAIVAAIERTRHRRREASMAKKKGKKKGKKK